MATPLLPSRLKYAFHVLSLVLMLLMLMLLIIFELTAAATACGLDTKSDQNILVYDLGSSTFDVSLLNVDCGASGVLATNGDTCLGDEDFDLCVMLHIFKTFNKKH
eukprot:10912216-Karenia_brevis.AAC.1